MFHRQKTTAVDVSIWKEHRRCFQTSNESFSNSINPIKFKWDFIYTSNFISYCFNTPVNFPNGIKFVQHSNNCQQMTAHNLCILNCKLLANGVAWRCEVNRNVQCVKHSRFAYSFIMAWILIEFEMQLSGFSVHLFWPNVDSNQI